MPDALPAVADPARDAPAPPRIPEPDWIARAADERGWTWARVQWARAAAQPGAWFDVAKADAVVARWPHWFRLTNDRFYDQQFFLNEWQEIIVRLLVGWKIPEDTIDPSTRQKRVVHVRLYRQLRLWIARKGGKTEFLAALALLFFIYEKVPGGEGYVFAKDEDQARVPFKKMGVMVNLNPALSGRVEVMKRAIYVPEIDGSIHLLSGSPGGKHGKGPTVVLGDEMHEWASTDLADTLRQGMGTRLQPIELYASTAGLKTNPTGMGLWEESQQILDGRVDQPSTLVVIFAADPDDDPFDEAVWLKANPSLGLTPTLRFMRSEAALAKGNPRKDAHFRCYHLNQWVDAEVRWLPLAKWDACAPDREAWRRYPREMDGRRCHGAFDVSATRDLTALVWAFDGDDGRTILVPRFWIPEESLAERERYSRLPWRHWVKIGAVETTPGDAVDQAYVQKAIAEGLAAYDVARIGRDPWNSAKLVGDLQASGMDPDLLIDMRQGPGTLGEPSKEFERLVFAGLLDHGGHPILRWMAGHCVVRFDENLNFVPAKKRSADKIDGIVASVMAVGLRLAPVDSASGGACY
jgi:phage terminase large subunit-like protein